MPIPLGVLAVAGAGAAGGGGSFDLLETTVLSTTTATVTFSNIDQTYKHLQVRVVGRDNSTEQTMAIRLNGDSGSNYSRHWLRGDGSNVTSSSTLNATQASVLYLASGGNAGANIFGAGIIDILDYTNTNKNTTIRSLTGAVGAPNSSIFLFSTLWNNTAAVTSITVKPFGSDSFVSGSRFSIYGIK